MKELTQQQKTELLADYHEWSSGYTPDETLPEDRKDYLRYGMADQFRADDETREAVEQFIMNYQPLPTCTCCPGTGYRDPACEVHGDKPTPKNPLNAQMDEVMGFIDEACKTAGIDDHARICEQTADKFHLWEEVPGETPSGEPLRCFPLWLSMIVQGQMREGGVV